VLGGLPFGKVGFLVAVSFGRGGGPGMRGDLRATRVGTSSSSLGLGFMTFVGASSASDSSQSDSTGIVGVDGGSSQSTCTSTVSRRWWRLAAARSAPGPGGVPVDEGVLEGLALPLELAAAGALEGGFDGGFVATGFGAALAPVGRGGTFGNACLLVMPVAFSGGVDFAFVGARGGTSVVGGSSSSNQPASTSSVWGGFEGRALSPLSLRAAMRRGAASCEGESLRWMWAPKKASA